MYRPVASFFTIDDDSGTPFTPIDSAICFPNDSNINTNTLGKSLWKVTRHADADALADEIEYAVVFPGVKDLPEDSFAYAINGTIHSNDSTVSCDDMMAVIYITGKHHRCAKIAFKMLDIDPSD
jgi:hypothetical protein